MQNKIIADNRPMSKPDGNWLEAVIDENRRVIGCKSSTGGFCFGFESHGIQSKISMSNEAFLAMLDIAHALTGGEIHGND